MNPGRAGRAPVAVGAVLLIVAALTGVSLLVPGVSTGLTSALFSGSEPVDGNTFTTVPDWTAPTTTSATLLNDVGNNGYLRQGSAYEACANVTDQGNPPSGVDTVTEDLAVAGSVITTGASSVPLSGGSFTCDGQSFNYKTGTQTADASIPEGPRTFQVTATDVEAHQASSVWSVIIDNTRATPTAFATTNIETSGILESGDAFTVTTSESTIDLDRIVQGWDGSPLSTGVELKVFNNGGEFGGDDGVTLCYNGSGSQCSAAGNGTNNILGRIDLGSKKYVVGGAVTFDATIEWSPGTDVFTVTLGPCTLLCNKVKTGDSSTATFEPMTGTLAGGIRDKAGNNTTASDTATETSVHF